MKKMTKVTSLACALMLAAGTAALAENAATETAPEVPAITQTAPETQAAPEAPAEA